MDPLYQAMLKEILLAKFVTCTDWRVNFKWKYLLAQNLVGGPWPINWKLFQLSF